MRSLTPLALALALATPAAFAAPPVGPASPGIVASQEKALKTFLPKAPKTHKAASKVQPRNRDDIYEQINGGSASFLENGMTDALFAQYAPKKGAAGQEIAVEIYRFATDAGALKQFKTLYENEGKPWEGGLAVQHEFGVEATVGRFILKATFNDGPNAEACKTLTAALAAATRK